MKLSRLAMITTAVSISSLFAHGAVASIFDDELTVAEQKTVACGKPVSHVVEIDGSEWPETTVYLKTDATPEQITAVFTDYALHEKLFRDEDGSGPIASVPHCDTASPSICEVDYETALPLVAGISIRPVGYTLRYALTAAQEDSYLVEWHKIRSDDMIIDFQGRFRIELLPENMGSLIAFELFVRPNSPLAPLLKKRVVTQVRKMTQQLVAQTAAEISDDPEELERQIQSLHRAQGK